MNSRQAKQLSLPNIMSKLGYEPIAIRKGGNEYWYKSPFRTEKDASFHTSYLGGKWIWNDFGDEGGTVIDFIMRHENYNRVGQALSYLENLYQGHFFQQLTNGRAGGNSSSKLSSFQQQTPPQAVNIPEVEKDLIFKKAHPIKNPIIYGYLTKDRAISRKLIDKYLVEVHYHNRNNGKDYFAFGMKNKSGGYEIRTASDKYKFKSALKARDITVIKGKEPDRKSINIFEGMTDFLSLLTMLKTDELAGDTIILHSLSSYAKAADYLKENDYKSIHTFLDNNPSGNKYTKKFQQDFGQMVIPQNQIYQPHEDLNDALKASKSKPYFSR